MSPDPLNPSLPGDTWDTLLWTILILILIYLLTKILRDNQTPVVRVLDTRSSGHHWEFSDMVISLPLNCSTCHCFLLTSQGQYCSNCGVASCMNAQCLCQANTVIQCKPMAVKLDKPTKFRHHWIDGNLPLNSECEVCEEECGDGPGIVDLRCCWCQRKVHKDCRPRLGDICDFGEHQQFIVPPYCVSVKPYRTVRHPKRRIISAVYTPFPKWRPLIVLANPKSGNNDAAILLSSFRSILNPAQVFDLNDQKVEDGLKWCQLVDQSVRCVCLVAGGDGSIGWVLNTIDSMGLTNPPALSFIPLGTGNDLARSLGYGAGADSGVNVDDVLRRMRDAQVVELDRWKVNVSPLRHFGIRLPQQELFMQNYLSIGVDALVTYNFHKARESPFYLISSRIINKLIYFSYGTKDVLERECKDLDKILDLYLDDKRVTLPNVEALVVLNIPCWGAGVRPWELGTEHKKFDPPSMCDGRLEVFCVYSSFHIAQLQVGLSEPHRVGQASKVRIRLLGSAPMQIDGEPWEQHPAEIQIEHHKTVKVMKVD